MEEQREPILVVDIHLTRGLLLVLALVLVAVVVGYLAWEPARVAASGVEAAPAGSSTMRQYYLTEAGYDGANATSACAAGYHMASIWEIVEPSALKYNTDLGQTLDDSGQGPPVSLGWMRTGNWMSYGALPGDGNCDTWTLNDAGAMGTVAWLSWGTQVVHVWNASTEECDSTLAVWCVED
jgi:hypothetical protein